VEAEFQILGDATEKLWKQDFSTNIWTVSDSSSSVFVPARSSLDKV